MEENYQKGIRGGDRGSRLGRISQCHQRKTVNHRAQTSKKRTLHRSDARGSLDERNQKQKIDFRMRPDTGIRGGKWLWGGRSGVTQAAAGVPCLAAKPR